MRQERDSLGEMMLSDDAYFGIGTARLVGLSLVPGPEFPAEIPQNIVLVRRAQAVAGGLDNSWSCSVASAVEKAAMLIGEGGFDLSPHLQVKPVHGGGARSLVLNVDEVLANVALELMGTRKGEYHILSPLFQMDKGTAYIEAFLAAFHITLINNLEEMLEESDLIIESLKLLERSLLTQGAIATIQYQDIAFSEIGVEFTRIQESLQRSRYQMEWFGTGLLRCWQGSPGALRILCELTGKELAINTMPLAFTGDFDSYVRYSSLLKVTAMAVMHFCNRMRFVIGCTKELNMPNLRSGPAFNPAGREFLVPDTVSQLAFSVVGGDATIQAAASGAGDSALAYIPLVSAQLVINTKNITTCLRLLNKSFICELTGNSEPGAKKIAESPLQAEQLISALGYDRAIQVARIAALTEKSVRVVVKKMKLLTEEQIDRYLPCPMDDESEQNAGNLD